MLGDFRGRPRDQLGVYNPVDIKIARKPPATISESQAMSNRKTLLIEAIYGVENGNGRRRATEFFPELHRASHGAYSVEFVTDVSASTSIDYIGSLREGIRSMDPYLGAQTTKNWLAEVFLSPMYTQSGNTRAFRFDPMTRMVDSEKWYRSRAILHELEWERHRDDRQVSRGRYMARRKGDTPDLAHQSANYQRLM